MDIPVVIHKDDDSIYGVTVPDIPGCYSYGDTVDEALRNTKDAIYGHIATLLELGEPVSIATTNMDALVHQPDYAGGIWALVELDMAKIDAKPERINISVPRFVLSQIDAYVEKRHETRSGFLSRAALEAIRKESEDTITA